MATDCKSVALRSYGGSNPPLSTKFCARFFLALPKAGVFKKAVVAQLVERVLGKDEVTSSILVNGSSF